MTSFANLLKRAIDAELEALRRGWEASASRSRERRAQRALAASRRRARRRRVLVTALAGSLMIAAVALVSGPGPRPGSSSDLAEAPFLDRLGGRSPARGAHRREPRPDPIPTARALGAAIRFADARAGVVSFAAIDVRGRLRGRDADRLYPAASVVKAVLLAAELRRLAASGETFDTSTRALLTAMIRFSDNEAANAIYARVGDPGVLSVAKRTGMNGLEIAGHWGNAQISAAGAARFFANLDRALPRRYRDFGRDLLGSVTESQSWGVPVAAGERWRVRFKGGWLPGKALVHQAAELRERDGARKLSMAVLTDAQPSFAYGVETVRGVAERLLRAGRR